jgi:hypothetical protein
MTRVDGRINLIRTATSGHYLVPCFEDMSGFREFYPDMADAVRTRVAHFTDEDGRDILVDAWLFVGAPDKPMGEIALDATPPELLRVGHRP